MPRRVTYKKRGRKSGGGLFDGKGLFGSKSNNPTNQTVPSSQPNPTNQTVPSSQPDQTKKPFFSTLLGIFKKKEPPAPVPGGKRKTKKNKTKKSKK